MKRVSVHLISAINKMKQISMKINEISNITLYNAI